MLRFRDIGLVVHNSRGGSSLNNGNFLLFFWRLSFNCSVTSTSRSCGQSFTIISEMRGNFPQFTDSTGISVALWKLGSFFFSSFIFQLTIASNFRLSSSPELRNITCCNRVQASEYACMAPSKFCALSSKTAVFAFWRALESMAFCDGCFELRLDDPVPALLFPA